MTIGNRDWSAVQKAKDITGREHFLQVEGKVELPSSSHVAKLERAEPQGINPAILILELRVRQEGVGASVMTWREVRHEERPVEPGRFSQVTVRHEGEDLATIDVQVIHSVAEQG